MFLAYPRRIVPQQSLFRSLSLAVMVCMLALLCYRVPLPGAIPSARLPDAPAFGKTPLSFAPNAGQSDPAVRFQAGALGGTLFFTPDAVVVSMPTTDHRPPTTGAEAHPSVVGRRSSVVRVRFDGANPQPRLAGAERLPGVMNYFVGDDPARWRTNLPTYAGIVYQQLYDGIGLRYDGVEGALKGTYTLAPGADPGRIRWRYEGAQSLRIEETSGNLLIAVPGNADTNADSVLGSRFSVLTEQAPVAWQDIGGRRVPVATRFVLYDEHGVPAQYAIRNTQYTVGFALGRYNVAYSLTIDPFLVYSAFVGGSKAEEGRDIAVDAQGNTYITGSTLSPDFPKAGPPQATYAGPTTANFGDAFIMKLNPAGTALVYMTYLGGSLQDVGDAITIDAQGNTYVTGMTESTNFPTKNALQPAPGGNSCSSPPCSDAFVTKLNAAGNALVYSTYLGGNRDENNGVLDVGTRHLALGIAVDSAHSVYVTGTTDSPNFPTANQAFGDLDGAFSDIFVTKIRPDGAALLYSSYLGGMGADFSGDIVADNIGNAYIIGATLAGNFPTKSPLQGQIASPGVADVVVAKFDTTKIGAASLVYSTYLGGDDSDYGFGIAVDSGGNMYLAGHTTSLNFPTKNPLQASNGNPTDPIPQDAFVAKLNSAGSQLLYSSYLGGAGDDVGYGLDIDSSGTMYITGQTGSDNFPVKGAWQSARADFSDVFVARLDPSKIGAASLVYSTYLGGNDRDFSYGIAVDSARNAYVTGVTGPASLYKFPTTTSIGPNGSSGGIFVAKFSPNPTRRAYLPVTRR
jgi:Beta-propeller repeat